MDEPTRVAVTIGDPSGIGAEIAVTGFREMSQYGGVVLVGDESAVRRAVAFTDRDLDVEVVDDVGEIRAADGTVPVIAVDNVPDLKYGELNPEYGKASLEYVERAVQLLQAGEVDAIATAPVHSEAMRLADSEYNTMRDVLYAYSDVDRSSILLLAHDLRVTHATFHVTVPEACELITTKQIYETIRITASALELIGFDSPRVAVAGLNPHAGGGRIGGKTEDREIRPAIERASEEGLDVVGPESPDSVFVDAAHGAYDGVVAMYHDQGHIPIKMLGTREDGTVESTSLIAGWPFAVTTVNHGPAFDIAGQGIASPASMIAAVRVAARAKPGRSEGRN